MTISSLQQNWLNPMASQFNQAAQVVKEGSLKAIQTIDQSIEGALGKEGKLLAFRIVKWAPVAAVAAFAPAYISLPVFISALAISIFSEAGSRAEKESNMVLFLHNVFRLNSLAVQYARAPSASLLFSIALSGVGAALCWKDAQGLSA